MTQSVNELCDSEFKLMQESPPMDASQHPSSERGFETTTHSDFKQENYQIERENDDELKKKDTLLVGTMNNKGL